MPSSSVSMSMSAFLMSRWILRNVLEPLRQTSADLNNANEIRLLIHDIVLAYCSPFLIAISSANRRWYLKHSLPMPSVVVKTKGVNVPC